MEHSGYPQQSGWTSINNPKEGSCTQSGWCVVSNRNAVTEDMENQGMLAVF